MGWNQLRRTKDAPLFEGVDIFATLQNNKCADLMYAIEANCEKVGVDILTMNADMMHALHMGTDM